MKKTIGVCNKCKKIWSNKRPNLFFSSSLLKITIAIAMFIVLSFIVNAGDVVVENGKLDVDSKLFVDGSGNTIIQKNNEVFLSIKNTENNGKDWRIVSAGSIGGVGVGKFSVYDTTAGLSRFTIDNNGNIGIGTTSPSQKLTVAGTIESTSGGFKFPDGTTQVTAASGGGGGATVFTPDAGNTLTNNLISYWKLDELSGNRFDSKNGNTLSSVNSVGIASGKQAKSAQFVAASSQYLTIQYLTIFSNSELSTGNIDFTIAAWVWLDSKPKQSAIVSKFNQLTNQREYWIRYAANLNGFGVGGFGFTVSSNGIDENEVVSSPTTINTGAWYFVVAWYDRTKSTINIQINNGPVNSQPQSKVFSGTADFDIGARGNPTPDSFWDGRIDEVGFWKRVLTAQEITDLYNSGIGNTYNTLGGTQWTTSGSNIYYNTGNVGIGTANPSEALQVAGTIRVSADNSNGIRFGDNILLLNPTQAVLQHQALGDSKTSSIHLTPTQGIKPTGTLAEYVLHRTSDQSWGGNYGRWSFTALGSVYNNVSGIYGEFGGTVRPTEFIFNIGYENPVGVFANYEPLRFMAGSDLGNVGFGIGATSTRDVIQLHVADIGSAGQRDSHKILLRGKANDGSEHAVDWRIFNDITSNSGGSTFLVQNRIDLASYATPLAIMSSGNVGIGIASPEEKLDVAGNVRAAAFFYSSDENLKEDINTVNGLDTVTKLRGVSFKWKESGEKGLGLVAQDVEKVVPEVVKTDSKTGVKTLNYGSLLGPVVEAIKDLDENSKEKDLKIAELEKKVAQLREEITNMKKEEK